MVSLMNDVTENLDWDRRVSDIGFVKDWKSHTLPRYATATCPMVDWVGLDSRP